MRKFIFLLVIALLLVPQVNAVSSSLRDVYAPKETMIGELTGGIIAPIQREQVSVVKDGHLDVAVQYDVTKLGNKYYIWLNAPANSGNYTLVIEDIIALVNGAPEIVEYRKDFSVRGVTVDYSIVPGFVLANEDFEILAIAYTETDIEIDFPEQRTVTLYPGTNYVDFSIANVLGVQQIAIKVGMYQVPARIVGADYICGDGRVDGREVCDGDNLNGKNCTTVSGGFVSGQLKCSSSCLIFDDGLCKLPEGPSGEACSLERLSLCLNQTSCNGIGGNWYNNTCNKYEQGAACDEQHAELCATQGTCLDSKGFWYNSSCHEEKESVCDNEHLNLCLTHGTCIDAEGFWQNNTCKESAGECGDGIIDIEEECDGTNLSVVNCSSSSVGYDYGNLSCISKGLEKECKFNLSECRLIPPPMPPSFLVFPAEIRDTVLISKSFPVYRFRITNTGTSKIVGLKLDYNSAKFEITPYRGVNISVNESTDFNVSVKESWKGIPFKGVVIAYSEDVYEYFLLDINFTETESEAMTGYYRNSTSQGPSYYCSELSGFSCGADETCGGNIVPTIDVSNCCVGSCESTSSGSGSSWIGYLIVGIVVLVAIIIFVKYRKTGKSKGSPLMGKMLEAKRNLP